MGIGGPTKRLTLQVPWHSICLAMPASLPPLANLSIILYYRDSRFQSLKSTICWSEGWFAVLGQPSSMMDYRHLVERTTQERYDASLTTLYNHEIDLGLVAPYRSVGRSKSLLEYLALENLGRWFLSVSYFNRLLYHGKGKPPVDNTLHD